MKPQQLAVAGALALGAALPIVADAMSVPPLDRAWSARQPVPPTIPLRDFFRNPDRAYYPLCRCEPWCRDRRFAPKRRWRLESPAGRE
jgi:hypothetical protein